MHGISGRPTHTDAPAVWHPARLASVVALSLLCISLAACTGGASVKIDTQADQVLKTMDAKLTEAKQVSFTGRRQIDGALLGDIDAPEDAQFIAWLKRPDKFRGRIFGTGRERHVYYDGGTFTILDAKKKLYASESVPGDVDVMVARLEKEFGVPVPVGDFIVSNPYVRMTAEAESGSYEGVENVGGKKCHHIAIKEAYIDWDLWVSVDKGLPVKLVVVATAMEGTPKYMIEFSEINLNPHIGEGFFTFQPPAGGKKIPIVPVESDAGEEG